MNLTTAGAENYGSKIFPTVYQLICRLQEHRTVGAVVFPTFYQMNKEKHLFLIKTLIFQRERDTVLLFPL